MEVKNDLIEPPSSWVSRPELKRQDFEKRFPESHKQISYHRAMLDLFPEYARPDGLVKTLTILDEYNLAVEIRDHFANRKYAYKNQDLHYSLFLLLLSYSYYSLKRFVDGTNHHSGRQYRT
jgi:hypothetical protein